MEIGIFAFAFQLFVDSLKCPHPRLSAQSEENQCCYRVSKYGMMLTQWVSNVTRLYTCCSNGVVGTNTVLSTHARREEKVRSKPEALTRPEATVQYFKEIRSCNDDFVARCSCTKTRHIHRDGCTCTCILCWLHCHARKGVYTCT